MFLGFTGRSWGVDKEVSLKPGEAFQVDHYDMRYTGPRMEVDQSKRMIFADLAVTDISTGQVVGKADPAKFIYRKMPESPTTEVSMLHSIRDDLYVVVGQVSAETKVATFQVHVNPLVSWIWIGVLILIFGSVISMWPELAVQEARGWSYLRMAGGLTSSIIFGIALAITPARAAAQTSSLHAGSVEINDPTEHALFGSLLCMCGDCARLPLSTCTCSTAEATRSEIRSKLRAGVSIDNIRADYVREYGAAALSVPPNSGGLQSIYLFPIAVAIGGLGLVFTLVRRWKKRGDEAAPIAAANGVSLDRDEYDAKLDEELKRLDEAQPR
jgi:cytochrome c-type biogenesis protein CcmF